jgi:hypothetical protein
MPENALAVFWSRQMQTSAMFRNGSARPKVLRPLQPERFCTTVFGHEWKPKKGIGEYKQVIFAICSECEKE